MLCLSLNKQAERTNMDKHTASEFVAEVATVIDAITAVIKTDATTVIARETISSASYRNIFTYR